ncbi:hypothetical protein [Hymenobacter pini]|uniref:hypothetical protein n=1 Tax=Hymenobacter pini TaxID=2880879 RepID=UPI001CF0E353|nr:hypothetical protein [Hymenobacter pini]MCA8832731.1 hypothetical protein [Hymenobacter pini]
METPRAFRASSETDLWQQVATDLEGQADLFDYRADLHQNGYHVRLEYDIDLGGGFEGGYELTTLTADLPADTAFHFALHEQDWVHEIGKLLGLQDVEVGDAELDKTFIITTNQPDTLSPLLLQPEVRAALLRHPAGRLVLAPASSEAGVPVQLTFSEERALTDLGELQEIYHALVVILQQLQPALGSK